MLDPKKDYIVAIIIFACLAGFNFARESNRYDLAMNDDQIRDSWVALRDLHPELYPTSDVPMYRGQSYKWFIPAYRAILRNVALWFNEDFSQALKFLGALETFVFLINTFILIKFFIPNTPASILGALTATPIRWTVGGTYWGASGFLTSQPRTLFLVFTPLFLWLFIRWRNSHKHYLLFLGIGLLANFHPISGYLFVQILLLTWLVIEGIKLQTIKKIVFASFFTLLGIVPYLLNFFDADPNNTFKGVAYTRFGVSPDFWTDLYFLLTGRYLAFPFLLFLMAYLILKKSNKLNQNYKVLLYFLIITGFISLCGELANALFYALTQFDVTLQYARAFRFIYLPIFVFVAALFAYILKAQIQYPLKILLILLILFGSIFSTGRTYLEWFFPLTIQDLAQVLLFDRDPVTVRQARELAQKRSFDLEDISHWMQHNLALADAMLIPPQHKELFITGHHEIISYDCHPISLAKDCVQEVIEKYPDAGFILVYNTELSLDFQIAHENQSYVVYQIR